MAKNKKAQEVESEEEEECTRLVYSTKRVLARGSADAPCTDADEVNKILNHKRKVRPSILRPSRVRIASVDPFPTTPNRDRA